MEKVKRNLKKIIAVIVAVIMLLLGWLFIKPTPIFPPTPSIAAESATFRPTATGDKSQCTPVGDSPNYKCVDEETPDEDTTYVQSSSSSATPTIDLYKIPDISISGILIYNVTVFARIRATHDLYKAGQYIVIETHNTKYTSNVFTPTTSYVTYSYTWVTNPYTNVSWTAEEVNELQIGVQLQSGQYLVGYYPARCTQVYVTLAVNDTSKPIILTMTDYPEIGYYVQGQSYLLTMVLQDSSGLSCVSFNTNASGSWLTENLTQSLSGTQASASFNVIPWIDPFFWRVWVNDTDGNTCYVEYWRYSLYSRFNARNFVKLDDSDRLFGLAHTTGRKVFYDNNTGLFLVFYTNETNMCVAFSDDGVTWTNHTIIRDSWVADHFYVDIWETSGVTYVDYEFGYEGVEYDDSRIWYRRGIINANRSITWLTSEQLVFQPLEGDEAYPEAMLIDNNGYPWIMIQNSTFSGQTHDNCTNWLYKSAYNNGIWQTATGFPKNLTVSPYGLWEMILLNYNNTVMCIEASGEKAAEIAEDDFFGYINVWFWNGTNLWYENATNIRPWYRDAHSALIDANGTLHIIYHDEYHYIRHSYRFANGTWIRDIIITTENVFPNSKTVPQVTIDLNYQRLYANWFDATGYLLMAETPIDSINWSKPYRILYFPNPALIGNSAIEKVANGKLSIAVQQQVSIMQTGYWCPDSDIFTYTYSPTAVYLYTLLSTGWNCFTAWNIDVGKTLGQVNASLNADGINWTAVGIEYVNGSSVFLVYENGEYIGYNTATVESTSDKFWIYCLEAGDWYHTYP